MSISPSSSSSQNNFEQAKKLFLIGLENIQKEMYEEAEKFLTLSLDLLPDRLSTLTNLCAVLIKLEKLEKASGLIAKAIELFPDNSTIYLSQGQLFEKNRNWDMALISYDKAIELKIDYAEAYFCRALIFQELKRLEESLANYDKALEVSDSYSIAKINREIVLKQLNHSDEAMQSGVIAAQAKQFDKALNLLQKAIEINNTNTHAHAYIGNVFKEMKYYDKALLSYEKAINLKPDFHEAYYNQGSVLKQLNRFDEALLSYGKAIALKPDYYEAYYNRASLLKDLKRPEEALLNYGKAIEIKPDMAIAYNNRGVVLRELRRIDDALKSYEKAIKFKSDYAEAYWNYSLALLLNGEFKRGFNHYEWRWKSEIIKKQAGERQFTQSLWLGKESLKNKTILIWSEQGLGDTIQFCRYTQLVKDLGGIVLIEVFKPLVTLLGGLKGVDSVIEKNATLPYFDYHCPLLSLPLAFNTELNSVPSPSPYLRSNSEKLKIWNQRLNTKLKPRIGLVWSGNIEHENDNYRSVSLANIIKILPTDFEMISLQKEVRSSDKVALTSSGIKHFGELLSDFSDTAALCELMDIVVSVDTSVAHLAGALGKTTWIMLPFVPDWRWLLDRDDSPWYDSVKLYRQDEDMQWEPVLKRIAADLIKFFT